MNGTLNYFSAEHEHMPIEISGDMAVLTGQSYVAAAVFGGGRSNWHLQQKCSLKKVNGVWKITQSVLVTNEAEHKYGKKRFEDIFKVD